MSEPAIAALVAAASRAVREVRDDDLVLPTPCRGWDLRHLLDHWLATLTALECTLRTGRLNRDDPWGLAEQDGQDLVETIVAALESLGEGLVTPGVTEGVGFSGMPQATTWHLAVAEVALHAWDVAASLGRAFEPDPWSVRLAATSIEAIARGAQLEGSFDAPRVCPDGSPWHKAIAASGRDPAWVRPSAQGRCTPLR